MDSRDNEPVEDQHQRSKRPREDDEENQTNVKKEVVESEIKSEIKAEETLDEFASQERHKRKQRASAALRTAIGHSSPLNVIQVLLEEGASAEGKPSLASAAILKGQTELASLLLEHGSYLDDTIWSAISGPNYENVKKKLSILDFIVKNLPEDSSQSFNRILKWTKTETYFSGTGRRAREEERLVECQLGVLALALQLGASNDLIEMMIKKGANVDFRYNYPNYWSTPLHDLLDQRHFPEAEMLRLIRILRKNGVTVDYSLERADGKTPIDKAIKSNFPPEVIRSLL